MNDIPNSAECSYCQKQYPLGEIVYDHFVPRSKGGKNGKENQVISCFTCNFSKGAKLFRSVDHVRQYIRGDNLIWKTDSDGYAIGLTKKQYFEEWLPKFYPRLAETGRVKNETA